MCDSGVLPFLDSVMSFFCWHAVDKKVWKDELINVFVAAREAVRHPIFDSVQPTNADPCICNSGYRQQL